MNANMEAIKSVAKARVPIMLVGAPGTGKTKTVQSMADEMEYGLITLVGSRMDPTDISGLPAASTYRDPVTKETIDVTSYHVQWWQAKVMSEKKIIVFLDEFSNTPPSVRASLLTFLQDREFPNGDKLPKETIVLGAMNPVEQAADGSELDLPTTNRMFFIAWDPPKEEWYRGMLKAWGKKVSDQEMYYRKMIVNFHKKRAGYLHVEPNGANSEESGNAYGANLADPSEMEVFQNAWPSRRSWDNLSVVLGKTPKSAGAAVQDIVAQGLVGFRAATAFREFLREQATYDPQEVLNDPDIFDWQNGSPGELTIVIRGITENWKEEQYENVAQFFIRVAQEERASEGAPYIKDVLRYLSDSTRNLEIPGEISRKEVLDPVMHSYRDVGKAAVGKKAAKQG